MPGNLLAKYAHGILEMLVEVCHLLVVCSQTSFSAFWPSPCLILCQCKLKKPTLNRLQWLPLILLLGLSQNYNLITILRLNLIVLTLILTFYHVHADRAQFESHPIKACKLGSAMEMSSPRLSKIACIEIYLFLCFVPVMKNSCCIFNSLTVLGHIIATSVSILQMITLLALSTTFACFTCTNILESASSWSEERSKAIDAESLGKITDSLPFLNPPASTNFCDSLNLVFPLSIQSLYKMSEYFLYFLDLTTF